jgi:hypothetical protein
MKYRTAKGTPGLAANRRGNVLVLAAFMMIVMMAMLAFSVDIGYVYTVRTELQRTADAAALAGAWELIAEDERVLGASLDEAKTEARVYASSFAGLNHVANGAPALAFEDVTIGYRADIYDRNEPINAFSPDANIVQVRVRKDSATNGRVPFFFARALGFTDVGMEAQATAALLTSFSGFRPPSDGSNLEILPFALDDVTWCDLKNGHIKTDDWCWDKESGQVTPGPDGICEVNLYPQGNGPPGNRGTVDIGGPDNSTLDISRQITDGIAPQDLEYHGGSLEFNDQGIISLNGDTGISAGFKDELVSIRGEPRIIPIFEQISGNGNNAMYTIVELVGIRIMEVKLTGKMNKKCLMIQPCTVQMKGGIPGDPGEQKTTFLVSPVALIR